MRAEDEFFGWREASIYLSLSRRRRLGMSVGNWRGLVLQELDGLVLEGV